VESTQYFRTHPQRRGREKSPCGETWSRVQWFSEASIGGFLRVVERQMTANNSALFHAIPVISALVVEPELDDALAVAAGLTACRLRVTIAHTFANAKERINTRVPEVLVTAVRLAEYNGLQLVLRAKALRPSVAAIVMSSTADPVLQADGEAMGATFVQKPIVGTELATAVFRTMLRDKGETASGPLRPPFERRVADRRVVPMVRPQDRRSGDRRRDIVSLLRLVARN
jgi:CheY-like chemotaxis protein